MKGYFIAKDSSVVEITFKELRKNLDTFFKMTHFLFLFGGSGVNLAMVRKMSRETPLYILKTV